MDALWHTQPDDDFIVCLANITNNYLIEFFSIKNPSASILKSYNLSSISYQKSDKLLNTIKNDTLYGI